MFNVAIYRARKGVPGIGLKLARALNAYEVTSERPAQRPANGAVVINYGRSTKPAWLQDLVDNNGYVVNKGSAVAKCVDKRVTLNELSVAGIPCLDYTLHRAEAQRWADNGTRVFARTIANGKKGKGIVIVHPGEQVPDAPLYTADWPKTHEFRVHVAFGKVIDLVQKKRMGEEKLAAMGIAEINEDVRNRGRGWVFAHKNRALRGATRPTLEKRALDAAKALGLDYCGIDMLVRLDEENNFIGAVVCEVNSAPGMSSPTTFASYVGAFKDFINNYTPDGFVDNKGDIQPIGE